MNPYLLPQYQQVPIYDTMREKLKREGNARREMIEWNWDSLYFAIPKCKTINPDDIEGVYFNDKKMTTVIKWKDGTTSKVKTQVDKGDTYNPETGMAMCICKKALGNKGNFNEVFKKWLPKEYK